MFEDITVDFREKCITNCNQSSVALKYRIGDQYYGQVVRFEKTSLTPQDIVNATNEMLLQALQVCKELNYGKKE